jgi:type IX secretion system PorP/SprF family membrane protein
MKAEKIVRKNHRYMHTGIVALLFAAVQMQAQDTHFSQFYMSPLTQNPALAGAVYDLQAIINYRDQWQSVAVPFTTMAASYDMRLNKKKAKKGFWAAGLNVFSDKAGDLQMGGTQVNLTAAYHVRLNNYNTLGAGLQGGFAQRSLNYSAIKAGNQYVGGVYDSNAPTGEPTGNSAVSYADAGAGIVWTFNNTSGSRNVTDNHDLRINVGAAVFHPNQPDYSFYKDGEKLFMKFVLHGNALISFPSTNLALVPGFMYARQGPAQELYAGTMLRYKLKQDSKYTGFSKGSAFSLGAYYRAGDALAASMLMEYSNYAIGISYDVNTSLLKTASSSRGGLEVTLRFVNPNPFMSGSATSPRFQ